MANSLKKFIERQLKENVPLSEIRKDLQEKGYGIEIINKAVREAIAGVDKRLPSVTVIQIGVLIVGVMIAVGVGVYFTGSKESTKGTSSVQSFDSFCKKFEGSTYNISCSKAIELALANTAGVVQNVAIGPVLTVDPSADPPRRVATDMWLVDVKLNNPSFDQTLQKEVKVLQIGIGLNDHSAIYREVIA